MFVSTSLLHRFKRFDFYFSFGTPPPSNNSPGPLVQVTRFADGGEPPPEEDVAGTHGGGGGGGRIVACYTTKVNYRPINRNQI